VRKRFWKIYGVNSESWANRYGIQPFEHPCACGRVFKTTIPIRSGQLVGLMAENCECGNTDAPFCIVRANGDLLAMTQRDWEIGIKKRRYASKEGV